jgi:hypothetical protein
MPRSAEYYERNKDKIKAQAKAWQASHREAARVASRKYYRKNRRRVLSRQAAYRRRKRIELVPARSDG